MRGILIPKPWSFAGIVVNHAIEHTENRLPILTVELCDEALKMTSVRKNVVFKAKKDKEIISALGNPE